MRVLLALVCLILTLGTASATGINARARGIDCGGGGGGVTFAPSFAPSYAPSFAAGGCVQQQALYGQQFYPPAQFLAPVYVPRQQFFAAPVYVPRGVNFNTGFRQQQFFRQPQFIGGGGGGINVNVNRGFFGRTRVNVNAGF